MPVPPYSVSNGRPRMSCSAKSAGRDPLADDLPDRVAEVLVLLRELVDIAERLGHGQDAR
jgi:hypothetical protein